MDATQGAAGKPPQTPPVASAAGTPGDDGKPKRKKPRKPRKPRRRLWARHTHGRPRLFSREGALAICRGVALGLSIVKAAEAVGYTKHNLNNWMRRGRRGEGAEYQWFVRQVDKARAYGIKKRVKRVTKAGAKDWKADQWMLGKIDREYFGDQKTVTHQGEVSQRIVSVNVNLTGGIGDGQAASLAGALLGSVIHPAALPSGMSDCPARPALTVSPARPAEAELLPPGEAIQTD